MAGKLSILFWNVGKKNLVVPISNLVRKHDIDIVVLAELAGPPDTTRRDLATRIGDLVSHVNLGGVPSKTHLFCIRNSSFVKHLYNNAGGRLCVFEARYPLFPRLLLGTVHLVSKAYEKEEALAEEARIVMSEMRRVCMRAGIQELVICGDFNLNPFDKGMIGADNFHAVMDKRVAERLQRTIQSRDYPMLYSPMWSLLGDHPSGPAGTYFYSPASHLTTHWHMLDQFLLSPQLLALTEITELEILSSDGNHSFLSENGIIRKDIYSDHLPIRIKLESKI